MSKIVAATFATLAALATAHGAAAQDTEEPSAAELATENAREYWSIKEPEADPCADLEADADTIVVCREKGDASRYLFERPVRADAEVTGGGAPRAPDVNGLPPCEAYQICIKGIGKVPPPAYMVDFDALPETPAGSAAARLYGGPTDAGTTASEPGADEEEAPTASEQVAEGQEDEVYGP